MTRKLAPCGTATAARRHRSRGEKVCEPCKQAVRDEKNARVAAKKEDAAAEARSAVAAVPPEQPRLVVLYELQRTLQGHLTTAQPASVAGISREMRAVAAEIAALTKTTSAGSQATGGGVDELQRRRRERRKDRGSAA